MTNFRTRIDFTNRQAKQYEKTDISLYGKTTFGLPYESLTKGPDLTKTGVTYNDGVLVSTYSGNTGSTVYVFGDSRMTIDEPSLITLTPSNSGETQFVGPTWVGYDMFTTSEGFTGYTNYSAVTYSLLPTVMIDLGSGQYSGEATSNFTVYSASSVDYTGNTVWVDVSGITRTNEIVISNNAVAGYVLTAINSNGETEWQPSSGGSASNTFVTGGTYNNSTGTATYVNNAGNSFDVSGFLTGSTGSDIYTTGSTLIDATVYFDTNDSLSAYTADLSGIAVWERLGTSAYITGNGNSVAGGSYSTAVGNATTATGNNSSHAEGYQTVASGQNGSHAEGHQTTASGDFGSHAEGFQTVASGDTSHAEGNNTIAGGNNSHAGGLRAESNGLASFAHFGSFSTGFGANSDFSAILGGENQNIDASSESSAIVGGFSNSIVGATGTTIIGGNNITAISDDTVYVPTLNLDSSLANDDALTQILVRATDGTVKYRDVSSIGGSGSTSYWLETGTGNTALKDSKGGSSITGTSTNSMTAGGNTNNIYDSLISFIGGGALNSIDGSSASSIIGGTGNTIDSSSVYSFIGGGALNQLGVANVSNSGIIVGYGNTIDGSAGFVDRSVIIGGIDNNINGTSDESVILGGVSNNLNGRSSAIISGENAKIQFGINRAVTIGGDSLEANSDDTVYVPYLNIRDFNSGSSITSIGVDISGNVVTGITEEVFYQSVGVNSKVKGQYYANYTNSVEGPAYISGKVPDNLNNIIALEVIALPDFSLTGRVDYNTEYGPVESPYNNTTGSLQITTSFGVNNLVSINMLPVMSALTSGDIFTLNAESIDSPSDLFIIGLKLKYN